MTSRYSDSMPAKILLLLQPFAKGNDCYRRRLTHHFYYTTQWVTASASYGNLVLVWGGLSVQKSEYGSAKWALVSVYKFILTYHHGSHVEGFFSYLSFSRSEKFCCHLIEIARIWSSQLQITTVFYSSILSSSLLSLCPFSESSASPPICAKDRVFDFESEAEANCFQLIPVGSGTKALSSNQKTVKLGQHSLKWNATSNSDSSLQLDFATGHHIAGSWLRRGGIKVWLYRDSASPGKQLKVEFKDTSGTILCLFNASLNFSGWRGIWVKFSECKPSGILFTHPVLSIMSSLP